MRRAAYINRGGSHDGHGQRKEFTLFISGRKGKHESARERERDRERRDRELGKGEGCKRVRSEGRSPGAVRERRRKVLVSFIWREGIFGVLWSPD